VLTVTGQGNVIGVKAGTAIVTVTLSGGKNEDGTAKADIVKTVTITVKRGISKIEGSFEIEAGAAFDASQYEVTVTFSDGTTEKIKLDDARVTMQEVDTSTVGETIYNVSVTIDGETRRGTITVNVVKGGGCKSSCGSSLTGGGIAIAGAVSLISAALCVSKKKKEL
jgi:bacterial group 3 Ig-like protein